MHVNRLADLKPYEAPGHHDMRMFRMQGRDAGPSDTAWLGMSQLLPGGRIDLSASPEEKFYVVLDGEVTFSNGTETVTLAKPLPLHIVYQTAWLDEDGTPQFRDDIYGWDKQTPAADANTVAEPCGS